LHNFLEFPIEATVIGQKFSKMVYSPVIGVRSWQIVEKAKFPRRLTDGAHSLSNFAANPCVGGVWSGYFQPVSFYVKMNHFMFPLEH